ncbi:hypothetical protein BIZ90_gp033 [Escherichia phage vB_EcoM_Alf5]|uniref:Uncharacterized protein n=1 Tax=Escherichia phage vB_EcoM_Alf5 TaxID=1873990 RepID=A0A1B1PD56_9CAUD|nr:hypothetical protein BIZ90_gp033 [Escherichia phage vB_EcoM_Alf5]ANT42095.1 hypothetical protein Alf5_033 [Escherichia phage vB_EcoM_Alf5]
MSKVQVVFPICDFSLERELDLYEEITDEIIWSVVDTTYDAYNKPFENTCFDLMVGNNKVNYFFVREFNDE